MMGVRRIRGALVLGMAMALAAGACSSSTTDTAAPSETPTTASPTTTEAVTTTLAPSTTTSTVAPTTTVAPAAASCDHPYFPARNGANWTYENLDQGITLWEITSVSDDGKEAVMEADLASPDGIIRATVNLVCDESGMSAPELAFVGLPFGAEVTQITDEGVFLLPADQLVEGATWTSLVSITATLPGDIEFGIERATNYTVLGSAAVTVPAGTFDAIMVQSESMLNIDAGGRTIETGSEEILWFSEGVGLVKEASDDTDDADFGSALVSYVVP